MFGGDLLQLELPAVAPIEKAMNRVPIVLAGMDVSQSPIEKLVIGKLGRLSAVFHKSWRFVIAGSNTHAFGTNQSGRLIVVFDL